MASLKEIKGRIASVQTTQKTTSAMRMVASAKLHRTQTLSQTFLEYVKEMQDIVDCLHSNNGEDNRANDASAALEETMEQGGRICLVPISSSSGLCGAFNSNMVKATLARVREYESEGRAVTVIPVGKKVAHELQKAGIDYVSDYINLADSIGNPKCDAYSEVSSFVARLIDMHGGNMFDSVEILYHHFKNMGSQVITTEHLDICTANVPVVITGTAGEGTQAYITEPSPSELMAELHPKLLNSKMYGILLDSVTSEHAARMMAMQTADDNAKELLQELTLLYNKSRQQAITNELIDIMGGKVAQ